MTILLLTAGAWAYECLGASDYPNGVICAGSPACVLLDNNKITLRFVQNGTPGYINTGASSPYGPFMRQFIVSGFQAWEAGPGKTLRGANLSVLVGPDTSAPFANDNIAGVGVMTAPYWVANMLDPDAVAVTLSNLDEVLPFSPCHILPSDTYFNGGKNLNALAIPTTQGMTAGTFSVMQVSSHEAVHHLGLGHSETSNRIANGLYPFGGNYGVNSDGVDEEAASFLRDNYPGPSTGRNIRLARFGGTIVNGSSGPQYLAVESWSVDGVPAPAGTIDPVSGFFETTFCPGDVLLGEDRVAPIVVSVSGMGPTESLAVRVKWKAVPTGASCSSVSAIDMHSLYSASIKQDVPSVVRPSYMVIPSSFAPGQVFRVCGQVNFANSSISETSTSDNVVMSELAFALSSVCPPQ